MAVFKDLLMKGVYYAELGATDSESWTEMMVDEFGQQLKPHINYIMRYSFMTVYEKADIDSSLKRDLRRELRRLKRVESKNEAKGY